MLQQGVLNNVEVLTFTVDSNSSQQLTELANIPPRTKHTIIHGRIDKFYNAKKGNDMTNV